MIAVLALLLGLAAAAPAAPEPRFFVAGDGTLALRNRATGEHIEVRYRRGDGRYDFAALEEIGRLMRSKGGGAQHEVTPRFAELLGWIHARTGAPLVLLSGYRTPAYNQGIRRRGGKAAGGSLHTEGLAADLAMPPDRGLELWLALRALDCCGVGFYQNRGFVHVDVGTPRFWEAGTSRAEEDLDSGNARVFARTDFDRYGPGEMILVRLHRVTAPPVRIERRARLVADGGAETAVAVEDVAPGAGDGCVEADAATRLLVKGAPATPRGRLVFTTCAPRPERTPERIESNPLAIR